MSSWMNNLRSFGRTGNGTNPNRPPNSGPSRSNTSSPLYTNTNLSAAPPSPSLSATVTSNEAAGNVSKKVPLFFREDYSGFIVKGNFMTLAAKPALLEEGEWLAHQIVEQTRLLGNMVKCVQIEDRSTGRPLCNDLTCPTMSTGSTIYTWVDTKGNPINLAAAPYIRNILTWVNGKIQDPSLFPTDTFASAPPSLSSGSTSTWLGKASGFPERFEIEIRNMYKQMFRCYAHLYWQHWIAFWELGTHRELNTCFVHFVNVGRLYTLFGEKDLEPMQPLIDLWVRQGVLPTIEKKAEDATAIATVAPAASSAV